MDSVRELLLDVYQEVYGPKVTMANLNKLADDLSQIAGRNRPWTGKFLHSVLKAYEGFATNGRLAKALAVLAAETDGADELQARVRSADGLLAVNELPPGTVILGKARRCATPGCPVCFVPTHPRQKYHSRACAETARRRRQNAARMNGSEKPEPGTLPTSL